jgi:hypothetical protein
MGSRVILFTFGVFGCVARAVGFRRESSYGIGSIQING